MKTLIKTPKKKSVKPLIQALPREPLTTKRKGAIICYVNANITRFGNSILLDQGVMLTLKAERTKAEVLYEWLKRKGYRYTAARGWYKKEKPVKS